MVALDDKFWSSGAFRPGLKPGDLIVDVRVPWTRKGQSCLYYRRARRKEFDLPIANAAFFGEADAQGKVLKGAR